MARAQTPVGTWGRITLTAQVEDERERDDGKRERRWRTRREGERAQRWRARTKVRDHEGGKLHEVERYGRTKAMAELALKEYLAKREAPREGAHAGSGGMSADMTMAEAGAVWLARIARPEANLSDNSRRQYRGAFTRYVERVDLATLTLREANRVPVLRGFLVSIADSHGSGAAKTARTVVSLILGAAVEDGALDTNAVRGLRVPRRSTPAPLVEPDRMTRLREAGVAEAEQDAARDTRRAFTRDERRHVVAFAASDEYAQRHDVADLIAFLAGTAARVSEALAQRWDDVDLEGGTVLVRGTKTKASTRLVPMAEGLADVLRARRARGVMPSGLVFASPVAGRTVRDSTNTLHHVRNVLDRAGFPWATSHTFRRTVASILDEDGHPLALAANILGHADPSMTASAYLGRRGDTSAARSSLAL